VVHYEMRRAEREERIREELREAQETEQALRAEIKSLHLQLGEVRKSQQTLLEESKKLNVKLEGLEVGEELRRHDKERERRGDETQRQRNGTAQGRGQTLAPP